MSQAMVLVLMLISSSQPTSTEKTAINSTDVEKLLPNLLSVVDLTGLLGLEKGDTKDIVVDKEANSVTKAGNKGVNQLKED